MESEKMSEALRLADELVAPVGTQSTYSVMQQAAAELRRLHALVMDKQGEIYGLTFARETERKTLDLVKAERDALRQIVADYPPIEAELREVADSLFRAEAERDALRADAERYRWLRDPANAYRDEWNYFGPYSSAAEIDAVIDAARAALKEAK